VLQKLVPICLCKVKVLMSCGKEEEEEFLENFFLALSQFNYDKAKEQAERERETAKQKGSIWVPFLTNLTQLAMAEKTYTSLLFLLPKGFLRKEVLYRSSSILINAGEL
ncbi:unnamed protein product, partial [Darwinula stevensoni]